MWTDRACVAPVAMGTMAKEPAQPFHDSATVVMPGVTLPVCALPGIGQITSLEAGLEV